MKSQVMVAAVCAAALSLMTGCDQVQQFLQGVSGGAPKVVSAQKAAELQQQQEEAPQVQGTVLATVNNVVITLEGFDEKVKSIESLSPEIKINTTDAKKAYLNDLITQELIVQEARARGIEATKEVHSAVDEFKKSFMARQLILDETKGIAIDPSEIEAFYNQYKREFAPPEEVRVREIVVSSEATAKEVMIALLQGGDFAALAKERSIASSAAKGGDVGLVKKGEKFEKFDEVVAALDVNQVSPIFKGPNGYYIVRVEEKKGGTPPSLSEVYDQIKNGLLQQKQGQRIKDLTDKLRKDAKIEIKENLL